MTDQTKVTQDALDAHIKIAEDRIDRKILALREAGYRQDAIAFTKSQLEDLESTIYNVLYANPRDAFVFLPIKTDVAAGAEIYSYRMVAEIGAPKIVADGAQDRPVVDTDLTKHTRQIYEVGTSYTYTVGDMDRGGLIDYAYVQDKARVAAQTVALGHNEYAMMGGTGVSGGNTAILGFFNDTAVNGATLTDADWTAVTGADAYASVTDMIHFVNTQSSGLHNVTDVALTTFCWNVVQQTLLNSAAGSQSVLAALRQNYPNITFHGSASGTGRGAAGVDRCVAWTKSSDVIEYVAPVVYQEAQADKQGFAYTVQTRGRMAGVINRYPLAMCYGDVTIA